MVRHLVTVDIEDELAHERNMSKAMMDDMYHCLKSLLNPEHNSLYLPHYLEVKRLVDEFEERYGDNA